MWDICTVVALATGLFLTGSPVLLAQPPASQATYHILAEKNVRIPLRDGVTLAADDHRPRALPTSSVPVMSTMAVCLAG